jgi:hypothetical protein
MQLASMKAELGRMNEENQRLRGMITQVTTSCQALQTHLAAQKQQHPQRQADAVAPRQFIDVIGGADVAEQQSNSSSSTGNKLEERGEESPSTAGWLSEGRQQQQQASKAHEQAQEATMRKARVSVRARSEAPIVRPHPHLLLFFSTKQATYYYIYIYEY